MAGISDILQQFRQKFGHKQQGMDQILPPNLAQMSGSEYLDANPSGGYPHPVSGQNPQEYTSQRQGASQTKMDALSGGLPMTPFLINKYRSDLSNPAWVIAHPIEAMKAKQKLDELLLLYQKNSQGGM